MKPGDIFYFQIFSIFLIPLDLLNDPAEPDSFCGGHDTFPSGHDSSNEFLRSFGFNQVNAVTKVSII